MKGAKVVIDANTGRSKGYGFVRFGNDDEKAQAMTEMNGKYCSTRAMRIGPATPRKSSGLLYFIVFVLFFIFCIDCANLCFVCYLFFFFS